MSEDKLEYVRVIGHISKNSGSASLRVGVGSVVLVDDGGKYQEARILEVKTRDTAIVVFRDDLLGEFREVRSEQMTLMVGD